MPAPRHCGALGTIIALNESETAMRFNSGIRPRITRMQRMASDLIGHSRAIRDRC